MKKILTKAKEIIEKNDNIFVFILIILSMIGISLNVLVIDTDEIWLFQNIYKLYNGFELYKDINNIITPLFLIVGKWLFNILGANFLTFRIYNMFLYGILFFITYLGFKELKFGKKKSLIIDLLILLGYYWITITGANYNIAVLIFWILGLYIALRKNKYNSIIQSIIWFLIFLTKQNVAVLYGISLFLYEIIKDEKIKTKLKNIFIEILLFGNMVFASSVILYNNNLLEGFINYAILGLNEFAMKNGIFNNEAFIKAVVVLFINLIFSILIIKKKLYVDEEKNQLLILNVFAYPNFLIAFPIFNKYHLAIGIYVSIILLIFIIKKVLTEFEWQLKDKHANLVLVSLILIVLGHSGYHLFQWKNSVEILQNNYAINKDNPLYGGVYEDGVFENIDTITNYIKNNSNKVIIFSTKASFYTIPLKVSNGVFDLPLKGNLGKDGEDGLIEKIKKLENTEILIKKNEEEVILQESLKAREYIKENFKKIGEIEEFEIYLSN